MYSAIKIYGRIYVARRRNEVAFEKKNCVSFQPII